MPDLEELYVETKNVIDNLKRHMKTKREELNTIAELLLAGEEEYIFSNGEMVLRKPTSHTATKIKK